MSQAASSSGARGSLMRRVSTRLTKNNNSTSLRSKCNLASTSKVAYRKHVPSFSTWPTFRSLQQPRHQQAAQQQQRRSLFIQTEDTPNPESIKFLPGRDVIPPDLQSSSASTGFYTTRDDEQAEIARSPLAKRLFKIEGVRSVYLGVDFVTVTKYATAHWDHIRVYILEAIMDHYTSGKPALTSIDQVTDTTIMDDDDEVVAMIKELLEQRIRPAVQEDGGDIRYVDWQEDTGVVTVQLAGSCVGCPSSAVTLKNGVENMMMHYVPEVTAVHALEVEEDGDQGGADGKLKTYEERLASAGIPFSE